MLQLCKNILILELPICIIVRYIDHFQGFDPDYILKRPWEKDPIARQLILGSLLGGAHVVKKGRCFMFREERRSSVKEYLKWKTSILGISYKENTRTVLIWSKNHPYIANLYSKNLDNSGKIKITVELLDSIDDLGLLVWYLGGGGYDNRSQTCRLTTKAETQVKKMLIEWFKTKWNIEPKATKRGLLFRVKETEKLLTLLYPMFRQYALPECIVDKMGHFAKENRPKIEAVNAKHRINKNPALHLSSILYNNILEECRKSTGEVFGVIYGTMLPRKVLGYVIIPFPSDKHGIYADPKALEKVKLPNRKYIGWFHSHLKDSFMPSGDDIATHLRLFPELKHVMMVVNLSESKIMVFDHIGSDGDFRVCHLID